jgi:hypothetical protein
MWYVVDVDQGKEKKEIQKLFIIMSKTIMQTLTD